jgi:hypothetical protein
MGRSSSTGHRPTRERCGVSSSREGGPTTSTRRRCMTSSNRPGGGEGLLEAGRHDDDEHLGRLVAHAEKAVGDVPGQVHEGGRRASEALVAADGVDGAAQHIERLVLLPVDVQRWAVPGRDAGFDQPERVAGGVRGGLDSPGPSPGGTNRGTTGPARWVGAVRRGGHRRGAYPRAGQAKLRPAGPAGRPVRPLELREAGLHAPLLATRYHEPRRERVTSIEPALSAWKAPRPSRVLRRRAPSGDGPLAVASIGVAQLVVVRLEELRDGAVDAMVGVVGVGLPVVAGDHPTGSHLPIEQRELLHGVIVGVGGVDVGPVEAVIGHAPKHVEVVADVHLDPTGLDLGAEALKDPTQGVDRAAVADAPVPLRGEEVPRVHQVEPLSLGGPQQHGGEPPLEDTKLGADASLGQELGHDVPSRAGGAGLPGGCDQLEEPRPQPPDR